MKKILLLVFLMLFFGGCLQTSDQNLLDFYTRSAILTDNVFVCDNLPDTGFSSGGRHAPAKSMSLRDECIYTFSLEKKNVSSCLLLDHHYPSHSCFESLLDSSKSLSFCLGANAVEVRDLCFFSLAGVKNDPTPCLNISKQSAITLVGDFSSRHPNLVDACFREFMTSSFNPTFCDNAQNNQSRDYCLLYLALAKEDPSVCCEISTDDYPEYDVVYSGGAPSPLRKRCYSGLSEFLSQETCDACPETEFCSKYL